VSFEPLFTQKEILLLKEITIDACWIVADVLYLERAINNIIVNALKYTPKKGRVTIVLEKANNKVHFSIKDTGIGIKEEDIDLICNRFYQVNNDINKTGGSGIGLAFSKEIIELHTGKLKIYSKPNKGSCFTIIFPQTEAGEIRSKVYDTIDVPIKVKPEEVKVKITNQKGLNFLIVDDNFEMRAYLKRILQKYNCIEAENGQEALDILSTQKIDFVLTDYMMPVINGLELIKRIKEKEMNVPILMLTARTDSKSKLNVLRLGIDDYLNKPFEKEELLIRIENAFYNHKNRNEFILNESVPKKELLDNNKWINDLRNYIYKECSNASMTQDDIAIHFKISKSSLHRKIKSETGLTPNALITEIKFQKARWLVEQNPTILLKTLALEVGYSHTTYFSKKYEQRFGIKPILEALA